MKKRIIITSTVSMIVNGRTTTPAHVEAIYRDSQDKKVAKLHGPLTYHDSMLVEAGRRIYEGVTI